MYERFYNFREKPFNLTPDPKFLYFSKHHQGALDHMLYGIHQREGFIVILGGIGAGKTTLSRCLLNRLDDNVQVALIVNPMLSDVDLLRTLVHDLRIPAMECVAPRVSRRIDDGEDNIADVATVKTEDPTPPSFNWVNQASKKELLDALNQFLLAQHAKGGATVVIIDEAQNLSLDVMEELRLLSNLETEKEKLLQIIFVGQKELEEKLKSSELKQLRQRISIQYELQPLSLEDTRNYVDHRILVACGAAKTNFTQGAIKEIFNYSKGFPRLINLVCDRALLAGFNSKSGAIDAKHVRLGIRSLLGEEEKGFFIKRFLSERLPIVLSLLFFLAGLIFFIGGGQGGLPTIKQWLHTQWNQITSSKIQTSATASQPSVEPSNIAMDQDETVINVEEPSSPVVANQQEVSVLTSEGGDGYYRIQIHSSKQQEKAQALIGKLEKEGYPAFMKEVNATGKPWYVVYVGPYQQLGQARIHFNALKFSGREPILLSISRSG